MYEVLANQSIRAFVRLHGSLLLIIILVSPLFLFRLAQSPHAWYDEGLNINAAQTLANTSIFGLTTGMGIRLADPAIQTGPPLIALMGIVGKLFDNNLLAIRLVMGIFGLLTFLSLYALAYRLYGQFAAFLIILLLIMMPPTDTTSTFIWLSRQFLGEIPAILCISLGCHLLLRDRPQAWVYVLVGIFWGLAIIIKSQVLLILSVTVVIWVIFRLVTNKQDKFYWLLTAFIMFGLYGLDSVWRNGMAGSMLADNTAVLREGIAIHILPFRAVQNLQDWRTLVRLLLSVLTLSALWFFIKRTAKPSPIFQQQTQPHRTIQNFLVLLISLWMVWFAFISIGWARYSFIGIIFTFVVLSGVGSALWSNLKLPTNTYAYMGLMLLALLMGYFVNRNGLNDSMGDDFFKMVTDIKTHIPPDARILSMEWDADNFLPQHFIYPPTHVVNVITENAFIRENTDYAFDSLAACPQYILLGSLRLDATVLKPALDIATAQPLFQEGIYQLYRVNTDQLPPSCPSKP